MKRKEVISCLKVLWLMYREFDCGSPDKVHPLVKRKMEALEYAIATLEALKNMYEEK